MDTKRVFADNKEEVAASKVERCASLHRSKVPVPVRVHDDNVDRDSRTMRKVKVD